jgi:L-ectoine synthase
MFIRTVEEVAGTDLDVPWGNGQSRRLVVKRDGVGFAVAQTLVLAGTESLLEYKNHFEACYCISGEGEVQDMAGNHYPIKPGTIYVLDKHDKHYVRARSDMVLLSVFNPPIEGHERHNLKGKGSSTYGE